MRSPQIAPQQNVPRHPDRPRPTWQWVLIGAICLGCAIAGAWVEIRFHKDNPVQSALPREPGAAPSPARAPGRD